MIRLNKEFVKSKEQLNQNCAIININKPKGIDNPHLLMQIKNLFHKYNLPVKKIGHAGALDPNATGVLSIGINEGTKFLFYLMGGQKTYLAQMNLHEDIREGKIKKALKKFIGKIKQTPPKRSSVKRVEREREVYSLEFIRKQDKEVYFKTTVESGTYIRTLCVAIGEELGIGAHLQNLKRIKHSNFSIDKSLSIKKLEKLLEQKNFQKLFTPVSKSLKHLKVVYISDQAKQKIFLGKFLAKQDLLAIDKGTKNNKALLCFDTNGNFLGILRTIKDLTNIKKIGGEYIIKPERLLKTNQ